MMFAFNPPGGAWALLLSARDIAPLFQRCPRNHLVHRRAAVTLNEPARFAFPFTMMSTT